MKKLEQHVEDHQQYKEAHGRCSSWLTSHHENLSSLSDTGGDREIVQGQLDKLHDFLVMKDEGQTMLHTAATWGEKTMTTTSGEGREVIQRQLHGLQQAWDAFMSGISDTRSMLETQVINSHNSLKVHQFCFNEGAYNSLTIG